VHGSKLPWRGGIKGKRGCLVRISLKNLSGQIQHHFRQWLQSKVAAGEDRVKTRDVSKS
jgi:hypothetical protein